MNIVCGLYLGNYSSLMLMKYIDGKLLMSRTNIDTNTNTNPFSVKLNGFVTLVSHIAFLNFVDATVVVLV